MSYFDPRNHHYKTKEVDYIVPERLIETRKYKGISLDEVAKEAGISKHQLGLYENGHKDIPKEILFVYMKLTGFRMRFFYREKWKRV